MQSNLTNPGFWDVHGLWFCIFMFFFPRLTLFFGTAWGGFLWWVGLVTFPRATVALIAIYCYWDTNWFLCLMAVIWAYFGEKLEKGILGF